MTIHSEKYGNSDINAYSDRHTALSTGARRGLTPPVYPTPGERVGMFALIAGLLFIASAAAGSAMLGVAAGAALAASVGSAMICVAADATEQRATA